MSEFEVEMFEDGGEIEVDFEQYQPMPGNSGGGTGAGITIDEHTLIFDNGILKVNTTAELSQDNTLPISSSGVYTIVGNINALLEEI